MRTRITELLGIKYPIIQGAMGWVSFPPLVAAVSNAGGLGILGMAMMTPDELQDYIRETRNLTGKPFGVNLVPESPHIDGMMDVIIEERVPVVSYGIGNPEVIIDRCKPHGIVALPTMGSVRHALRAEQDGADAVIIQGTEAGGHSSYVSTMVLLPLVVDRVKIPVVAGGGIGDARGLVAALALGAEGISMGSRFIATQESSVPSNIKQLILQANEEDTVVTTNITGIRMRVLRNKQAEEFLELELRERKTRSKEQIDIGSGTVRRGYVEGEEEWSSLPCGQVCGMIDDIPTCRELIERMVSGAEGVLEAAMAKIIS